MGRGGFRVGSGPKKGAKYTKKGEVKLPPIRKIGGIPEDIISDAAVANMDPLNYMLKVMNDPLVDPARRDRMAVSAAPFCHPRKGESGTGKKDEQEDKADRAAKGKFAIGKSPLALVK